MLNLLIKIFHSAKVEKAEAEILFCRSVPTAPIHTTRHAHTCPGIELSPERVVIVLCKPADSIFSHIQV